MHSSVAVLSNVVTTWQTQFKKKDYVLLLDKTCQSLLIPRGTDSRGTLDL